MCGVAAIFAYHYAATPIRRGELLRMSEHMRLRGPDGADHWFSDDERLGMAHRRLAIIDLDERAAQPMVSACGRYRITFNGEIYNYRQLRSDLERTGAVLRTQSDTEVLLEMLAREGMNALSRVRGMYAFILYDDLKRRLWLARDPYGIKPLYYADDGWCLRAASQVKTLLAGGQVSRAIEPAGQVGFLLWGSVPDPFTCYQAIRAVPAGSVVEVNELGALPPRQIHGINTRYRQSEDQNKEPGAVVEALRAAIRDSVLAHQIADVPVGAFLSGGVDSSAILGMMAKQGAPIQAATIVFERFLGSPLDESKLAAEVAERYGASHHIRVITDTEISQDMPQILDAMDQPSIDGINMWFVSKSCAELGLRVAMSGVGGDELLGGYPSFSSLPRWRRWAWLPAKIPGLGRTVRLLSQPVLGMTTKLPTRAAGFFELAGTHAGAYLLRRGLFMPWELPSLIGRELAEAGLKRLQPIQLVQDSLPSNSTSSMARVSCLESIHYLRNQLLRDCDWASMAHSLEVRTPLVDFELLGQVAPLICAQPNLISKAALTDCPNPILPDSITQRAKTGFATPMAHGTWPNMPLPGDRSARQMLSRARLEQAPARRFAGWIWEAYANAI